MLESIKISLASFRRASARSLFPARRGARPVFIINSTIRYGVPGLSTFLFTQDSVTVAVPVHAVFHHGLHVILSDITKQGVSLHHPERHPHIPVFFNCFFGNYVTEVLG